MPETFYNNVNLEDMVNHNISLGRKAMEIQRQLLLACQVISETLANTLEVWSSENYYKQEPTAVIDYVVSAEHIEALRNVLLTVRYSPK